MCFRWLLREERELREAELGEGRGRSGRGFAEERNETRRRLLFEGKEREGRRREDERCDLTQQGKDQEEEEELLEVEKEELEVGAARRKRTKRSARFPRPPNPRVELDSPSLSQDSTRPNSILFYRKAEVEEWKDWVLLRTMILDVFLQEEEAELPSSLEEEAREVERIEVLQEEEEEEP